MMMATDGGDPTAVEAAAEARAEEKESLAAIFGADFWAEEGGDAADEEEWSVRLCDAGAVDVVRLRLPTGYPLHAPARLVLDGAGAGEEVTQLRARVQERCVEAAEEGEPVAYDVISMVQEWLEKRRPPPAPSLAPSVEQEQQEQQQQHVEEEKEQLAESLVTVAGEGEEDVRQETASALARTRLQREVQVEVWHGDTIVDRQSVFQAHVARVQCQEEVDAFVAECTADRKVARATHNILAYAYTTESGAHLRDNDDDGEHGAGRKLAELLFVLKVDNVAVMVSRWYGGIQLGPARFKHINNAARQSLVASGILMPSGDAVAAEPPNANTRKRGGGGGKKKHKAR